jgi:hypothetical protein
MQTVLKFISFIGLGLTIIPSILVLTGDATMGQNKFMMLTGTILWFSTVVFWMNKKKTA